MGRLESRTERSEGGGVAAVCGARSAEHKRAVAESPHANFVKFFFPCGLYRRVIDFLLATVISGILKNC